MYRYEDDKFRREVFPDVLDEAIAWIAAHMTPEQVFSEDQLNRWAEETGEWVTRLEYEKLEQQLDEVPIV